MGDQILKERVGDFQSILNATPDAAGIEIEIDGKRYISGYNVVGSAVSIGQPVTIAYDNTYGTKVIANATTTFAVKTAVAVNATASLALDWWQVSGEAEALVDGDSSDVAAGNYLEVLNGGSAFVYDDTSRTTVSAACAVDANTGAAALKTVTLIEEQHTIAGS